MKRILVLLAVAVSCVIAVRAAEIYGYVVDKADSSPLINASIRILNQRDSAYVNGCVTDVNGRFSLKGLSRGRYIVEASYLGYRTAGVNVRMADARLRVDTIALAANTIVLREAEVVGVKTEVKVVQDTVEYNADSYKTQPNAVVEDLLKRLPGVEVGSDGKITAQGKTITKILVDGEDFFTDDAKVASKNIPVDLVDKLQVIDRKSDLARLTGVDDGEDETVINLTVKKGMKRGWFGNVLAGYGTDDRYMGNFMVNRFVDKNQFSLLGNLNNINDPGFTNPGAGRFRRFGGINGVNSAQSIGINFNVGKSNIFRVGGDVMYSHSDQKTITSSNKQYILQDSTSLETADKSARDRTHNFVGNFRMKWERDSFNIFEFRPNFKVSVNDSYSNESTALFGYIDRTKPVNDSQTYSSSDGTSYDLGAQIVYNRNFKRRRGRSFSAQVQYRFSNTVEDETSQAVNRFFDELTGDVSDEDTYDQYTDNHQWSSRIGARLTWKEPIGDIKKALFWTLSYRMNYYFNNADKLVYDLTSIYDPDATTKALAARGIVTNPVVARTLADDLSADYILDEELSNRFRNDQFDQQIRVGIQQSTKKYRLNLGLSLDPVMMRSEDLYNPARNIPSNWTWNYSPYMRFRYMFTKQNSLGLDYRGRSTSPSITQLQPVLDKSDPMKLVQGNPSLVPSFTHNFNIRYNNYNQESQRSLMAMANFSLVQNSIVSRTDFDDKGVQTTTYENVNGAWSANAMSMFTTPFKNRNWHFSNNLFLRYSRTVGYNNGLINHSGSTMFSETPSIAFRNGLVDIELRPYYNLQVARNSVQTSADRNIHTYGSTFNANYYAPFGLVLSSDLSYSGTSGYSEGYDNEQWLWNASIGYQFLKNKCATLTVKAYDLLRQKLNISRTVTANYITDNEYNTVTRYFMLTFAYKFSIFGKGSSEKDFNYGGFGPGPGPGGPMRAPMGMPGPPPRM
ncbi:MAG: outer membrane beta-barrel protein [Candidatus Limisoma sp.]|nr:outer membrane beta-barrel protein [Candidatus Limisoma sp.]